MDARKIGYDRRYISSLMAAMAILGGENVTLCAPNKESEQRFIADVKQRIVEHNRLIAELEGKK